MKPIGSNSPDLILRSPAKRSDAGRLEGWQLVPSPAAILRDASLVRCSSECEKHSSTSICHGRFAMIRLHCMRSRG